LLGFFFNPEDGGSMFLWNVGWLSMTTWYYIQETDFFLIICVCVPICLSPHNLWTDKLGFIAIHSFLSLSTLRLMSVMWNFEMWQAQHQTVWDLEIFCWCRVYCQSSIMWVMIVELDNKVR
jgi:hypothetical protein